MAVIKTCRKFKGIEIDKTYYTIANKQIDDAVRAVAGKPKHLRGEINDTSGLPMFAEVNA